MQADRAGLLRWEAERAAAAAAAGGAWVWPPRPAAGSQLRAAKSRRRTTPAEHAALAHIEALWPPAADGPATAALLAALGGCAPVPPANGVAAADTEGAATTAGGGEAAGARGEAEPGRLGLADPGLAEGAAGPVDWARVGKAGISRRDYITLKKRPQVPSLVVPPPEAPPPAAAPTGCCDWPAC